MCDCSLLFQNKLNIGEFSLINGLIILNIQWIHNLSYYFIIFCPNNTLDNIKLTQINYNLKSLYSIIFYNQLLLGAYHQDIMNLAEIIVSFSTLYRTKRINFTQIQPLLQLYYKLDDKGPLLKKLSIISTLVYFFHQALKTEIASIERLKHQVFYPFITSCKIEKERSERTIKKNHRREKKVNISMDQILEIVVNEKLDSLDISMPLEKVRAQKTQTFNKNSVILPPFEPNIIEELTQDVNLQLKTPRKQHQLADCQPNKLDDYKKWLALTQNGISMPNKEKFPRTKKKNVQKQQTSLEDKKIDISQGLSNKEIVENIKTKIKASRQFLQKHEKKINMSSYFEKINSVLKDNNRLILLLGNSLNLKKNTIPSKQKQVVRNANTSNLQQDFNYFNEEISRNNNDFPNQDFSEAIFERGLSKMITQALSKKKQITFSSLWKQSKLKGKESKGYYFYQILHMNLNLKQKNINTFGQILISR